MPATTFGVVVAAGSKQIRRILAISDQALASYKPDAGESLLIFPIPQSPLDLAAIKALVQQATGTVPPDLVCAVVDQANTVVEMFAGDAAVDTKHPAGQVIDAYSPDVTLGCTYDPIGKQFTVPGFVVPATTDRFTGQPVAQKIVPPRVLARPVVVAP